MKNYIFLFTILSFLVACGSGTNEGKDITTDETDKTISAAEEEWNTFWDEFQLSITKNDVGGIVNHISFPIKNLVVDGQIIEQTSKVDFIKHYKDIFGNGLRERIISAKTEEWKSIVIKNENDAKMYKTPMNAEVKSLQLNFIFNEGAPNQTESTQMLNFAKKDGKYKWCSMNVAG